MSFHPLGSAADAHPLTTAPAELPFHHNDEDDDDWTPPALPGETRILPSSSSRTAKAYGRGGGGGGGGGRNSSTSAPIDPLRSNPGAGAGERDSLGNGRGAAAEEESYRRAVNSRNNSNINDDSRNYGAAGGERGRAAGGGVIGQAAAAHGGGGQAVLMSQCLHVSIERAGRHMCVCVFLRGHGYTFVFGVVVWFALTGYAVQQWPTACFDLRNRPQKTPLFPTWVRSR